MTDLSVTEASSDLFKDILKNTDSKVVESGIKVVFTTDKSRENVSDDILKSLDFYDGQSDLVLKNEQTYCVEFGKNNINGYIEIMQYENHNVVTVNIVKYDNKSSLEELRNKLQKYIGSKYSNIKYYQYLKCKMQSGDIYTVNKQILQLLKNHRASNIDTVDLENGYSTTAYTNQYDSIESNGKLVDFNYAVTKYSSGNYIIIGTPEILVTY